jgi:hypothetical protein
MKEEYTFVTLGNDMVTMGDAVFVDIDETAGTEMDFVHIDESYADIRQNDLADFIILDEADFVVDDNIDAYVSDICEADVSILI